MEDDSDLVTPLYVAQVMFVPLPRPLVMTVRVVVMFATFMLSLLNMMLDRLLKKWLLAPSMNTIELLLAYINPGEKLITSFPEM